MAPVISEVIYADARTMSVYPTSNSRIHHPSLRSAVQSSNLGFESICFLLIQTPQHNTNQVYDSSDHTDRGRISHIFMFFPTNRKLAQVEESGIRQDNWRNISVDTRAQSSIISDYNNHSKWLRPQALAIKRMVFSLSTLLRHQEIHLSNQPASHQVLR